MVTETHNIWVQWSQSWDKGKILLLNLAITQRESDKKNCHQFSHHLVAPHQGSHFQPSWEMAPLSRQYLLHHILFVTGLSFQREPFLLTAVVVLACWLFTISIHIFILVLIQKLPMCHFNILIVWHVFNRHTFQVTRGRMVLLMSGWTCCPSLCIGSWS